MNDIPGVPKLLLGNNLLQAGSATISYNSSPNQEPTVTFNHPEFFSPLVFFKNSEELNLCRGMCSIGPYEMGSMIVYLDSGALNTPSKTSKREQSLYRYDSRGDWGQMARGQNAQIDLSRN